MDSVPYYKHISLIWPKSHFHWLIKPPRPHKTLPKKPIPLFADKNYQSINPWLTHHHLLQPPLDVTKQEHSNKLLQNRIPSSTYKYVRHLREQYLNTSSPGTAEATAESHTASLPTNKAGLGAQIQHWWVVKFPHCFPEAVAPKQNNFLVTVIFFLFLRTCMQVWGVLGDPGCRNESSSEGHAWKHLIVLPSQSHR